MNKVKQWAVSVIVFLLIGIILFLNIAEVLRKKAGAESDMVHSFYAIEENTLDVLCMGSSHGYSAFQPNTLWNDYGVTSYVLCSQRQTAASTYYLLKEALKYQKPKVLLLEAYYFFSGKKYTDEAALRTGFDGMRMGEAKRQMIHDFLDDQTFEDKLSYYLPFLKYHSRWEELYNHDFHPKDYLKGSIMDAEVYPMEEPELPKEGRKISDTVYEYFEKIVELCRENDVQPVLFTVPYGYENEDEFESYMKRQKVNITLESYLAKKNIPYIYFQKDNAAGIDYAADFRDYAHLNIHGAIKITKYLGEYMNQRYSLPDHRKEDKYQSWWTDYDEFQEYMNMTLEKADDEGRGI